MPFINFKAEKAKQSLNNQPHTVVQHEILVLQNLDSLVWVSAIESSVKSKLNVTPKVLFVHKNGIWFILLT